MTADRQIENMWALCQAREVAPAPLSGDTLRSIVSSRVRKEFKRVSEFVWAAIVYQIILYSFLAHTLVRLWGDLPIILACAAGGAAYGLLTFVFLRSARNLFQPNSSKESDLLRSVEGLYARLADFFRFKKRMDWIGVPVGCAIIVFVTFTLWVKGGLAANPVAGFVAFAIWVGMSLIAIRAENEKRFMTPLRHLQAVLDDLKRSEA